MVVTTSFDSYEGDQYKKDDSTGSGDVAKTPVDRAPEEAGES